MEAEDAMAFIISINCYLVFFIWKRTVTLIDLEIVFITIIVALFIVEIVLDNEWYVVRSSLHSNVSYSYHTGWDDFLRIRYLLSIIAMLTQYVHGELSTLLNGTIHKSRNPEATGRQSSKDSYILMFCFLFIFTIFGSFEMHFHCLTWFQNAFMSQLTALYLCKVKKQGKVF